jgi:uncharacterized repeat protein (TIGR03943 family)
VTRDPGRLLRAALLFGFALLIAKLFWTGQMVKFMAPALDPLTAATGVVLAAMSLMGLAGSGRPRAHGHRSGAPETLEQALTLVLVLAPVALGLVVTPRALGAGALGGENVANLLLAYAPGGPALASTGPPPPARPVDDVAGVLAYLEQTGEAGVGQRVRVTGIALPSDALEPGEFALLRYSIVHCVADARPIGLLVVTAGAGEPPAGEWVEVRGALAARERGGDRLVTIQADEVIAVPEPRNPYL